MSLRNGILRNFCAILLLLGYGVASAGEADVRKLVAAKFPGVKIASVIRTPYGGLYEIYMGGNIFYTDDKMSFILAGNLIDTKTSINVTQQRLRKLTAVNIGEIPLELGIRKVKGNGQRKLIVFSDPLCPFCQQFEQQLLKIDNITIYVMLYPVEHLHPGATELSKTIWCSRDPGQAWDDWMLKKQRPSGAPSCKGDPIAQLDRIGTKLGINTTPTVVFADGAVVAGMVEAPQIEKLLADTPPGQPR